MKYFTNIKNGDFVFLILVIIFCYYKHITSVNHIAIFYAVFEDLLILFPMTLIVSGFTKFKRISFLIILCFSLFYPLVDVVGTPFAELIDKIGMDSFTYQKISSAMILFLSILFLILIRWRALDLRYFILLIMVPLSTLISHKYIVESINSEFDFINESNEKLFSQRDPSDAIESFCSDKKCIVLNKSDSTYEDFLNIIPDYVLAEVETKDEEIFRTRWFEDEVIKDIPIKLPNYLIVTPMSVIHVEDKERLIAFVVYIYNEVFKWMTLFVLTIIIYSIFSLRLFTKDKSITV